MKTNVEIQTLDWTTAKPLAERIRREVFIVEQEVPESEEWDKWDSFAVHVVAISAGKAIGTGRLTREGKVGRMAVLKDYRNQGIGTELLKALLDCAEDRQMTQLSLHAQTYITAFYEKFGFKKIGSEFMEAGIKHVLMERIT